MKIQGSQRNALTMLLAAANGLLLLIIVLEASGLSLSAVSNRVGSKDSDTGLPVLKDSIPKPPPLSAYEEMIARPLFVAGRRPVAMSGDDAEDKKLFTLKGVVITADQREALLSMQGNSKVAVVKPGDWFGGWKIETIEQGHVVMTKSDGRSMALVLKRAPPAEADKGRPAVVLPPHK